MDKVYRVEDSEGRGPYTSDLFMHHLQFTAPHARPSWVKMLGQHQCCPRHPGPYVDWKGSPIFNRYITEFNFGCPSPTALVGWFSLLGDLIDAGFKVVEVSVWKRYDSNTGYQSAFHRDEVDSKRVLSYKEVIELAETN
jgi:hypothetical protein